MREEVVPSAKDRGIAHRLSLALCATPGEVNLSNILRSLLFDVTFYLWTALISVASLPVLLASQRGTIWISKLWAIVSLMLLRLTVGLTHEVRGQHNLPKGPVIVALKHQSAWDTIALWVLLENPAIVLKRGLAMIPVFGWYMKRGKAIVIDRNAGAKALRPMIAAARSAVVERRPIAIFPEGTRTPVGARQSYLPGVAALYMQLGLPLVPVALNSGLFWERRSFLKRPGRIVVEFLPAIEPGFGRRHVMAELEHRIEQATANLVVEGARMNSASRSIMAEGLSAIDDDHSIDASEHRSKELRPTAGQSFPDRAIARTPVTSIPEKLQKDSKLARRIIGSGVGMVMLRAFFRQIIRNGTLTLIGPDGRYWPIGYGTPSLAIRIINSSVILRLLTNPDLALGEAYMDGALVIEGGDIYDFLDLCLANLGWKSGHWVRRLRSTIKRLGKCISRQNAIPIARANVAHHYDLSDTLYELFLDADRQYSCAYYDSPADTLEDAQEHKKRHLAAKLLLRPGLRILDIGSGWGGLALDLARIVDVDVTGVTLSTEQHAYAQNRANKIGVDDRVRFLLKDYRQEHGRYDRIVSVGMFEHVGVGQYREYFKKVKELLEDDGLALIHTIGRADGPGAANAWINKYIFPGGYVPALSEILPAVERAGLYVTDIEVLRLHYAETLKAWRNRFDANRKRVAELYDERFCRMWEFYLAGCEAAFRHGGLVNFQIQLSKRIDTVPLSRNYIADWERSHADDIPFTDVVVSARRNGS